MDPLSTQLVQYLSEYGPWLLFAMAILETCFITGLLVPSGLATSVGTALALEGAMTLPEVAAAALAGGFVGDSAGYWIGRVTGDRLLAGSGRVSRTFASRHRAASRFFGRSPLFSVTLARLVSFVRTVMPMAAGMSRLPYLVYLPFELLGLVVWAALYMAIGAAAGEGWDQTVRNVGVGGGLAFVGAGLVLWTLFRRRRAGRGPESDDEP